MRLPRIAALLLVILLVSGHTAALQVVAWAGMLVERAPTMSLGNAVRSTFDGSNPCKVCYAVRDLRRVDGQHAERTHSQTPTAKAPLPAPHLMMATILELPVANQTTLGKAIHGASPVCSAWAAEVPTPPPCHT